MNGITGVPRDRHDVDSIGEIVREDGNHDYNSDMKIIMKSQTHVIPSVKL